MTRVTIIDYGSGNLRSAAKALERAGALVEVSDRPEALARADRIVLPGVGAFAECMRALSALDGMIEALNEQVIRLARPFLGICVGMQLMADDGQEHGTTPGLGWIAGSVVPIEGRSGDGAPLKVPHMGWNDLALPAPAHPLFHGLSSGADVYFVHSYHVAPEDPRTILASVDYGSTIPAAIGRDNLVGTQFHPEKSQTLGLKILANFLEWRP